jgi:putative ABC transport system permease protein
VSGLIAILRRLNVRHIRERRLRAALTIAGVMAGVALVFSVSVINATLGSSLRTTLQTIAGGADIEVTAADNTGIPIRARDDIARIDGVRRAVPGIRMVSRVAGPGGESRVLLLGITQDFPRLFAGRRELRDSVSISGDFGSNGRGIVLSADAARETGTRPGGRVALTVPGRAVSIPVTGIASGSAIRSVQGGRLAVMTLPAAQAVLGRPGRVDTIWVQTARDASINAVARDIDRGLKGAAIVGKPGESARGFERTLGAVATMTSMAGTVALFVALFVVYNAMSMALSERRREISMVLAVGGSRRQLFGAFLGEAAVLGSIASAAGTGLGLLMARLLIDRVATSAEALGVAPGTPVTVTASHIALALGGGLAVSLAGAFIPARRILSVAPIEALRPQAAYEWMPASRRRGERPIGAMLGIASFAAGIAGAMLSSKIPEETWPMTLSLVFMMTGTSLVLPRIVPLAMRSSKRGLARTFGPVGRLSADALLKNPARTTLTVSTLVLTGSLVIAIGAGFGSYGKALRHHAFGWFGAPLFVQASSFTGFRPDQPLQASLRPRLEAVDGVGFAYPMRYAQIDLDGDHVVLYAVPVVQAAREGASRTLSVPGGSQNRFIGHLARGELVISRLMATRRGLEPGDLVSIPTPTGRRTFRVGDVFEDLNGFEASYIEYGTYARVWGTTHADRFYILPETGRETGAVAGALRRFIRQESLPADVLTQDEAVDDLVGTVLGFLALAQGIGVAALVVAVLTVANTMFTTVLERRWEFGLQRAVGMARRQLGRSVMLEAGVMGLVGGAGAVVLGTGIGALFLRGMEAGFAWRVPYQVPLATIAAGLVGGALLAASAGVYPQRLAIRPPIIEALRYE